MTSIVSLIVIFVPFYFFISHIISVGKFDSEDSRNAAKILFRVAFGVLLVIGIYKVSVSEIKNYKFQKRDEAFREEQRSIMNEVPAKKQNNEPVKLTSKIITKQDREDYAKNLQKTYTNDGIQIGVFTGMNGSGNNDDLEFWSWEFNKKSAKSYLTNSELQKSWSSLGFKTVEAHNTSTHEHWILNLSTNKIKYKKG